MNLFLLTTCGTLTFFVDFFQLFRHVIYRGIYKEKGKYAGYPLSVSGTFEHCFRSIAL